MLLRFLYILTVGLTLKYIVTLKSNESGMLSLINPFELNGFSSDYRLSSQLGVVFKS